MARLAVMAHYDPTGGVGPHVRRQVEALASTFDDLVVVTTASLTRSARSWLGDRARLIERDNEGYDFFSYRTGLQSTGGLEALAAYDEVAICNDTYVGPLRSYARVLAEMEGREADFWGFTRSERVKSHLQSFFVVFRSSALRSPAFLDFWAGLEPLSDRWTVIKRYEVGMSQRLMRAGLRPAAYFEPTAADERMARRRVRWWAAHRDRLPRSREELRRLRRWATAMPNPAIGLADRALDDGRLPMIKLDTLRYDPYGLDAGHLLDLAEARFPDAFEGVRDFLAATARFYPPRAQEALQPTPALLRPLRRTVRYRAPGR